MWLISGETVLYITNVSIMKMFTRTCLVEINIMSKMFKNVYYILVFLFFYDRPDILPNYESTLFYPLRSQPGTCK